MIGNIDISQNMLEAQAKKLEGMKESLNLSKSDAKLQKTACQFEAMFLSMFLEKMDATVEKTGFLSGGSAEKNFKSMMFNQMALDSASNPATSVGIAKQIYQQISKNG